VGGSTLRECSGGLQKGGPVLSKKKTKRKKKKKKKKKKKSTRKNKKKKKHGGRGSRKEKRIKKQTQIQIHSFTIQLFFFFALHADFLSA
jgi:hypothetical protein